MLLENPTISLQVTLYKPYGDEDLRRFASSLQASTTPCVEPVPSGEPDLVKVSIQEEWSVARPKVNQDGSFEEPSSMTATLMNALYSPNLGSETLDVRSENGWFGIYSLNTTARNLNLYNVWIGSDSLILEQLVNLHLDCNLRLPDKGPLCGEWLLTMLSKTKNLEVCTLHLEPADIFASLSDCPPEVKLEKIKKFDISHHWVQIQTLFSKLVLPETAEVNISTVVPNSEDPNALIRLIFPSQWPTSKQAWMQKKLKLDLSQGVAKYRIGDNHTITVKHDESAGAWRLAPSVIGGCGRPESTVTDLEISFDPGFEGPIGSRWWNDVLLSNGKLDSLVCSNGRIQDLCDALGSQVIRDGIEYEKCPELRRLVIRDVNFAVGGTVSALTRMLGKRTGLECGIQNCTGLESEESSGVRRYVESVDQ
jgi:hypothetical protein